MNFTQTLDNLIANTQYFLKEQKKIRVSWSPMMT